MAVIGTILSQHAESASSLWLRRDRAVGGPHFSPGDLTRLDRQLDAHLDALRIGGQAGWDAADHELRWREPGEVFAAGLLALEGGSDASIRRVLSLAVDSRNLSRALVSALGWLPLDLAAVHIDRFLAAESPLLRRIGIAASAVHRHDPGSALENCLRDSDSSVRARSLRALGELGLVDLMPAVREHLQDAAAHCRIEAAWSAALLSGDAASVGLLRDIVADRKGVGFQSLQLVLRRIEPDAAKTWLRELSAGGPPRARLAVTGTGALGDTELVPWLIEQMRLRPLARAAGEAFTMITGLDLAYHNLERKPPKDFESGPSENPADENVEMDPDENLPWPDQARIAGWWQEHSSEFTPGTRYLLGRPACENWLEHVLRHGYQRQRAAAALELAIRRPGTPLFEVRAPGFRQQELLS
jgi:uncharacterized protein (TIGR02270 family)